MKMCDDPSDPEKVIQTISEVYAFVEGRESIPYTMEEIKAIGTPVPKAKITCERKI